MHMEYITIAPPEAFLSTDPRRFILQEFNSSLMMDVKSLKIKR